jgi:hypothetical protein
MISHSVESVMCMPTTKDERHDSHVWSFGQFHRDDTAQPHDQAFHAYDLERPDFGIFAPKELHKELKRLNDYESVHVRSHNKLMCALTFMTE